MKKFLLLLLALLAGGCSTIKYVPVETVKYVTVEKKDSVEVFVHDSVYVNNYIHERNDTVFVENIQYKWKIQYKDKIVIQKDTVSVVQKETIEVPAQLTKTQQNLIAMGKASYAFIAIIVLALLIFVGTKIYKKFF